MEGHAEVGRVWNRLLSSCPLYFLHCRHCHHHALSWREKKPFQYSGMRQTMWHRGGRCSGVGLNILPRICPKLSCYLSPYFEASTWPISGVEKLYLCAGLAQSIMGFRSCCQVRFVLDLIIFFWQHLFSKVQIIE